MYIHLTYKERVFIALMIVRGKTYTHIAQEIGVNKSTISREVTRNKCPDGIYRARKAHKRVQERRKGVKEEERKAKNNKTIRFIEQLSDMGQRQGGGKELSGWLPYYLEIEKIRCALFRISKWVEKL